MEQSKKRAMLIVASLILTFVIMRIYLHLSPSTNLDVGPYNIHHLFTGMLLVTFAGLPLVLFAGTQRWLNWMAVLFGAGLSMVLDEWVYLITTDGSDSAYLLPISFWGGVIMVGLACCYIAILVVYANRSKR